MDIVESDLKQLFMWTKLQDDGINSLQKLCRLQDERISNIEHDLALVLTVVKDGKDST